MKRNFSKLYLLFSLLLLFGGGISGLFAQTMSVTIFPRYIGNTNANQRVGNVFRISLTGLAASTQYDFSAGAYFSTSPTGTYGPWCLFDSSGNVIDDSMKTPGTYAINAFKSNSSGGQNLWVVVFPSGTHFAVGESAKLRVWVRKTGFTTSSTLTSDSSMTCCNLSSSGGNFAWLTGKVSGMGGKFVFAWGDTAGTGRPLSGYIAEPNSISEVNYPTYYNTSTDNYGIPVPSGSSGGIQRLSVLNGNATTWAVFTNSQGFPATTNAAAGSVIPFCPVLRSQFSILLNTYDATEDSTVDLCKPYLQSGDVVTVVSGNSNQQLNGTTDMTNLSNRLTALHDSLDSKGVTMTILTSRLDNVTTIANHISPSLASYIIYDYEPSYEPEFTYNFDTTLINIHSAATTARNKSFKGATAPTGRGLWNTTDFPNWDYGLIADTTDFMITQTQSALKSDADSGHTNIPYFKTYANKLMVQLINHGAVSSSSNFVEFPQVTIHGGGSDNGAPLSYCETGTEALHNDGFHGFSLWFADPARDSVLALVKYWRSSSGGSSQPIGRPAVDGGKGLPQEFALFPNYPNPFNPSTTIKYNLAKAQVVTLKIYNVLGQEVTTLVSRRQNAGYYEVNFNADRLASGVYYCVLRTNDFNAVQKMLLLK